MIEIEQIIYKQMHVNRLHHILYQTALLFCFTHLIGISSPAFFFGLFVRYNISISCVFFFPVCSCFVYSLFAIPIWKTKLILVDKIKKYTHNVENRYKYKYLYIYNFFFIRSLHKVERKTYFVYGKTFFRFLFYYS